MPEGFLTLVEQNSNLDPIMYQYFNCYFNRRTIIFNRAVDRDIVEAVIVPLKEFEEDDKPRPSVLKLVVQGFCQGQILIL